MSFCLLGFIDSAGPVGEDIDKVTSRFHRVSSHGRSFEGTGIGVRLYTHLLTLPSSAEG